MASATTTRGAAGRGTLSTVLFYVFLVTFVLVSVAPLLWIFKMSIITRAELFASEARDGVFRRYLTMKPDAPDAAWVRQMAG